MGKRLIVAFALLAAALPVLARPAVGLTIEVESDAATARLTGEVDRIAHEGFSDVAALVGSSGDGPPIRVILASEGSELAKHAPSWVSGYALGERSTIVLFPGRVPSYPDHNLATLLRHEVAHILLARATQDHPVPRWFNEGVATVAAREWGLEDRARYAMAVIGRGPDSLTALDRGFTGDGQEITRAYALSAALVRHIQSRFGAGVIARIAAAVRLGVPFDAAFRRVTGESLFDEADRFFRRDAVWNTWVPFLTSSTALWMAITALAILAFRRRRLRDEALRDEWAALDGTIRPDPPDDPSMGDDELIN